MELILTQSLKIHNTMCHSRCADVTVRPIKVPDTQAGAQSRRHLTDMHEQTPHPACHPDGLKAEAGSDA